MTVERQKTNRKIDVDKLTDEQFQAAIKNIADKMSGNLNGIVDESNKLLNRYGLACRVNLLIDTEENLKEK